MDGANRGEHKFKIRVLPPNMLVHSIILLFISSCVAASPSQSDHSMTVHRRTAKCASNIPSHSTQTFPQAATKPDPAVMNVPNTVKQAPILLAQTPAASPTPTRASSVKPVDAVQMPAAKQVSLVQAPVGNSAMDAAAIKDCLAAHNNARAKRGLNPLVWDVAIAAKAQIWAQAMHDQNNMHHSGMPGLGENIAMGVPTCAMATNLLWLAEEATYVSLGSPAISQNYKGPKIGHYTQVMWAKTERLGCGLVLDKNAYGYGVGWVSCSYDPPGNRWGQKPY